jgi:hypothetical protein
VLQRRDQYGEDVLDEDVLDAMACATQYWMRFFAALRMTKRGEWRRLRDNF